MYKQNSSQVFPPVFNVCPDYYTLDSNGQCIANSNVWPDVIENNLSSIRTNLKCNDVNFLGNTVAGMGQKSSLCAKKQWSEDCGVTWDGITDNHMICYSEYVESK